VVVGPLAPSELLFALPYWQYGCTYFSGWKALFGKHKTVSSFEEKMGEAIGNMLSVYAT